MVKHTVKSFKRENKFHTYLTRETLPAEERVSKFHNHGETSSCQILADASDATSKAFVEGRTHKFIVQQLKFQLRHVSFSTCSPRKVQTWDIQDRPEQKSLEVLRQFLDFV